MTASIAVASSILGFVLFALLFDALLAHLRSRLVSRGLQSRQFIAHAEQICWRVKDGKK